MCEINAEKLIKAMQVRPALYDKNDSMYFSHKKYKSKMWKEVCREIFGNWDQLRPQDKVEYCHEVMKRWKSLRTCFTRELAVQKKENLRRERNDGPIKRRKRYEYFNLMRFLLDPAENIEPSHEEMEPVRDSDESSSDPLNHNNVKTEMYEDVRNSKITIEAETEQYPQFFDRSSNMEEMLADMLKTVKKDEEDEDRQFMLSLVPTFRKLKTEHKFDAKIEILKVLKEFSFRE